jgi:PAS domain S-box-containing protein
MVTNVVTWTDELYRIFGVTPQNFAANFEGFLSMVHPEDRERVTAEVNSTRQTGNPFSIDFRIVRADGEVRVVHSNGAISSWKSGNTARMAGTAQDITETSMSIAAIRQDKTTLERRFKALIEHNADGVALIDRSGTIVYESPSVTKVLGFHPRERVGRDAFELIHLDDLEEMKRLFFRNIQNPGASWSFRFRARRKDGEWRWIEGNAQNLLGESSVQAVVANFRDVTELIRSQEQLRLLANAVECTSDMICITDLDNRFVFVNRAFLEKYGYTEAEVLGRTPEILFSRRHKKSLREKIYRETRKGGWTGELFDVKRDGTEFPISLSTSTIRDGRGHIVGLVGVARDITERKRAERALQEANRRFENLFAGPDSTLAAAPSSADDLASVTMMDDLAARIDRVVGRMRAGMKQSLSFASLASHELRTPLTIIRHELEEVMRAKTPPGAMRKALFSVYDEILSLGGIIDSLISLSTLLSGTFRLDRKRLDFNTFVREIFESLVPITTQKGIRLTIECQEPIMVEFDPDRFRQVLFNLFDNAVKFSRDGGEITVGTLIQGDDMLLRFTDTGSGICPEDLPHIFEPFYQGGKSGGVPSGSGLGLALVRLIVEAHTGSIEVSSGPDKGTTFYIRVPTRSAH